MWDEDSSCVTQVCALNQINVLINKHYALYSSVKLTNVGVPCLLHDTPILQIIIINHFSLKFVPSFGLINEHI